MHLLQVGSAKSGNLWLYKILEQIFLRAGIKRKSFVQQQPVYSLAKEWPLSYTGQAGIDMLDIQNEQCYWRISTIFRMPVDQVEEYVSNSSHVWTHSRFCRNSKKVYPLFDKVVYVLRDPFDRAVSEAKFAFSTYMQRFSPPSESSFEAYLEHHLEDVMNRWRWHVYDHLRFAEELNIHFVFYERLLRDFRSELNRLLDYLDLHLSVADKLAVASAVHFSSMKKQHPRHLRKGTSGNREKHFSADQIERANALIQPLASYLNYHSPALPYIPDYLDRSFLEKHLHEIGSRVPV